MDPTAAKVLGGPPPPEWLEELGQDETEETSFGRPLTVASSGAVSATSVIVGVDDSIKVSISELQWVQRFEPCAEASSCTATTPYRAMAT